MPKFEIEIGEDQLLEDGSVRPGAIGSLPEPVQKFVQKKIDEGYKKGAQKTEQRLSPYVIDPQEVERLRQRDSALAEIEKKELERQGEYEKARQKQEEEHAKRLDAAVKAERAERAKVVDKLKQSVHKNIRAAALAHGAREESLGELERLLAADVDLDDELNEYVVDAKNRKDKRTNDKGEPVTVEGLVAEYLAKHQHHLKATPAKSGGAKGGATLAGNPPLGGNDDRARARAAVAADPSTRNVAALLRMATTKE